MRKYILIVIALYAPLSQAADYSVAELATKPQSELNGLLTNAIKKENIDLIKNLIEAKALVTNLCPHQVVGGCRIKIPNNESIMKLLSQAAVEQFNSHSSYS